MKCPKCGFISFDYNDVCPKCKKDITGERDKMHHVSFRPDVPFLIGSLIGERGSGVGLGIHEPDILTPMDSGAFSMSNLPQEDLSTIDASSGFESEFPEKEEFPPAEEEEIEIGLEEIEFDENDVLMDSDSPEAFTAIDGPEEHPPPGEEALDEGTLSIELDDLVEVEPEMEDTSEYVNEEALTIEVEPEQPKIQESQIEVGGIDAESDISFSAPGIGDLEIEGETLDDLDAEMAKASRDEMDRLFSLEGVKQDRIVEYPTSDELPRIPGVESDPFEGKKASISSSGPAVKSSDPSKVWTEIAKDLEELDFDIDDSD